jgi:hypothetical protein
VQGIYRTSDLCRFWRFTRVIPCWNHAHPGGNDRSPLLCYNPKMRTVVLALLCMPLASMAQGESEAAETEQVRQDLKRALEMDFQQPEKMYVFPKGSVVPGEVYRLKNSEDSRLILESIKGQKSGIAAAPTVTAQQVMAPQAAIGANVESGTSTPPWVGLLLKRLDDIDNRVKRLEKTGGKK